jgi:hypothetical protein
MASVGGTTVDSFRGQLQGPSAMAEPYTRSGVAGAGFVVNLASAPASSIETAKLYDTLANARAARVTFEALHGTVVTVVDSVGETWTDVLVVTAQHEVMAVTGAAGFTAMLRSSWTMIAEN